MCSSVALVSSLSFLQAPITCIHTACITSFSSSEGTHFSEDIRKESKLSDLLKEFRWSDPIMLFRSFNRCKSALYRCQVIHLINPDQDLELLVSPS